MAGPIIIFRNGQPCMRGPWHCALVAERNRVRVVVSATLSALAIFVGAGTANARTCDGPAECCSAIEAHVVRTPETVRLGVVLVGLYNVNEKSGTWDADFYLNESWIPTPGFTPETEIVNEVARQSEQFDDTELHDARCYRSRRIHSTLRSSYNLRAFPFDRQRLTLEFSDAEFDERLLGYEERPSVSALNDGAKDELSSWKIAGALGYSHQIRVFQEEGAAPHYDYATFSVPVKRHVTYHLTKFFLPLLVIVVVAFTLFWIHPEDLNSKAAIGVTSLLAAIAFQLAEAGTLPEVAYLTLADRVYALCYIMLAVSIMFAVYTNSLVRKNRKVAALRLDRICRMAFPVCLVFGLILAVVRSG
jgi:hypothetical protein